VVTWRYRTRRHMLEPERPEGTTFRQTWDPPPENGFPFNNVRVRGQAHTRSTSVTLYPRERSTPLKGDQGWPRGYGWPSPGLPQCSS